MDRRDDRHGVEARERLHRRGRLRARSTGRNSWCGIWTPTDAPRCCSAPTGPVIDPERAVREIGELGLRAESRAALMRGNALRVFRLSRERVRDHPHSVGLSGTMSAAPIVLPPGFRAVTNGVRDMLQRGTRAGQDRADLRRGARAPMPGSQSASAGSVRWRGMGWASRRVRASRSCPGTASNISRSSTGWRRPGWWLPPSTRARPQPSSATSSMIAGDAGGVRVRRVRSPVARRRLPGARAHHRHRPGIRGAAGAGASRSRLVGRRGMGRVLDPLHFRHHRQAARSGVAAPRTRAGRVSAWRPNMAATGRTTSSWP